MKEVVMTKQEISVLCMEDSPADAELIRQILLSEGYTLRFKLVSSETEFVTQLKNGGFDIILSDYNLPEFDGMHALACVINYCPEVPFICVSGTIGEYLAVEMLKKGAADYVLKDKLEKLPIAVRRSLNEVQEQKALIQAQNELIESERNYRTLADSGRALIWSSGTDKGCTYFNRVWLDFTGRTLEQELDFGWTESVHPDDLSVCTDLYITSFDKREKFNIEYRLKRYDGEYRWIIDDGCPRFDSKGKFIGYIGHCLDITERKQVEEELIKAKEKAEESDRLKTAFLTNISHEIRTPMNGILGFAELLNTPGLSGEKQAEFIRIIERSGRRMLDIINDIVEISKIEAGYQELHPEETHVNHVLKDLYDFFEPETKNVMLSYETGLSDDESRIETDSAKLAQILTNLIKNALKFTDSGSIEYGYAVKGDKLEFFVKDTGIGIAPDQQDLIFERFRQADTTYTRGYEGAGLGLSISKAYVGMLGGQLWIESEIGKGSTFYFTITYNPITGSQEKISGVTGISGISRAINILIADDDYAVRFYFMELLQDDNIRLSYATNGQEALDLIRSGEQIDLILMDFSMPVMDGFESARRIKEYGPDIRIIAQTAYAFSENEDRAKQAGCDEFITKPINRDTLFALILKYIKDQPVKAVGNSQ
jgi:PAS domain S-box-containing protein